MATILKGAPVASAIDDHTRSKLSLLAKKGIFPVLAVVRIGKRQDDIAYENSVVKRCDKVGIGIKLVTLSESITQDDLINTIETLNSDPLVHGILLFMPLPKHFDSEAVRKMLSTEKDVDGITDGSLAGVFTGSLSGFPPCTAQACIEILDYYGIECTGRKAVVIGRSLVIGKPVSMMLISKNATVTVCHTKTTDMPSIAREADILIAAAGKPGMVSSQFLSTRQAVIDVGINFVDGVMCGDVDFSTAESIVSAITPVPGGVGSVTTSVLINHVVEAASRQSKI